MHSEKTRGIFMDDWQPVYLQKKPLNRYVCFYTQGNDSIL